MTDNPDRSGAHAGSNSDAVIETALDMGAYSKGLAGSLAYVVDRIAELEQMKAKCKRRSSRRPMNRELHRLKQMRGYLEKAEAARC